MSELIQEYDSIMKTYFFSFEDNNIYLKEIYEKIIKNEKEKNEEFKPEELKKEKKEINENKIFINNIAMLYKYDKINHYYLIKLLTPISFNPIRIYPPKKIKLGLNEATIFNYENLQSFTTYHNINSNDISINNNPNFFLNGILNISEDLINITVNQNINAEKEYDVKIKIKESNLLSDLCEEEKYIKFTKESQYFDTSERIEFINSIIKLLMYYKTLFVYGPSGIGKSVTLLNFSRKTDNLVLYLNLKYLFQIYDLSRLYKEIIGELSYCFTDKVEFNNFINKYLKSILLTTKDKNDQYDFIFKIIKEISSKIVLSLPLDKLVYIILDQYQSNFDIEKKLIKTLNESKYIKVIICSSMNESNVRETISNIFFNEVPVKSIYNFPLFYLGNIDLSDLLGFSFKKRNLFLKMFGQLPRYYEEIKNLNEDNTDVFVQKKYSYISKKINNLLNAKVYNTEKSKIKIIRNILANENVELETNNFKEIFDFLPLKYFIVLKNKNGTFTYKYAFQFIKYVYETILKEALNTINKELFDDSQYSVEKAWNFEHLVNNYFIENTKPFTDLEYVIKKTIYVDSIYDLKEVDFQVSLNDNNISLNEDNILIYKIEGTQEKIKKCRELIIEGGIINICQRPCGESYDGALLIPTGKGKEYYMLLYQVTLDKDNSTFLCRLKIVDSIPNIKKNFESIYDIKIKGFYFIYILYFFRRGLVKVEKLCNQYTNNLYYCYYNPETKELLNKRAQKLRWSTIKQNCKIIKLSKDIINYNKTLYYSDEVKDEINEKLLNLKINREKNDNSFENVMEEEEKNLIQKKLKYNAITYNISKLKTVDDEKFTEKKSLSFKENSDIITTASSTKKKNQIKSEKKKYYLEESKLKHISDLIPQINDFEKKNIQGINNYLNESLASKIKKLFSIDKNIIINGRNFYNIQHIINQNNVFLLYYNAIKNELILAYNDDIKKAIILYDLIKKEKISSDEYCVIITSFLNLDYLINHKIICYFLYFEF